MNCFNFKTLLLLCFIVPSGLLSAQETEPVNTYQLIKFNSSQKLRASNSQGILKNHLAKGNADYEFKMIGVDADEIGFTYQKFQEFYKGIKVEFGVEKLHAKNDLVTLLSGEFYKIGKLDINPALSSETALNSALNHVGATHYLWEDPVASQAMDEYQKPSGELLILPDLDNPSEQYLAYKFDIYATEPLSRDFIYVDANTGKILLIENIIKHLGEYKNSGNRAVLDNSFESALDVLAAGNAATRYSGNRTIETRVISGQYALRDNTRGDGVNTYNSGRSNSYPNTNFFDNDNNWTAAEHDNSFKDNGALDAQWGAGSTYDYWATQHNRNSFNGNGAAINSWVHFDDQPGGAGYDNAFWNGSVMTYGDGNNFDILTSLDVVAHEIGHAVTSSTANLAYRRESGGMNEGYSDIWGAAVEHFARGVGTDTSPAAAVWQIGEDLNNTGGLRSMSDPKAKGDPDTYRGTNWVPATVAEGCQSPSRQNDQCGVHSNSGVLNHWFYILVAGKSGTNDVGDTYNVTGIGMTKAAQIAYRNLNVYLGANATFAQARSTGIQSAEDLFGADSPEVIETTNAWYAVGVGAEYNGGDGNPDGATCSTTVTNFPYSQSFENTIGAWSQSSSDDINWTVNANGTPSNNTGPSGAIAGNYYIYMEVSGDGVGFPNKRAIITSPCFDLPSSANLSFNYHMTGNAVGSVTLEASTDNGGSWTSVWNRSGDQGGSWNSANVDLSAFSNSTVQLRFNGLSGSSWQGDISIDNLAITNGGSQGGSGCSGGISSFPYNEGFENTLGAWTQSSSDDINWTLDANGTPSNNTGPSGAVQGSYYVYIEASGNGAGFPNKRAILNSPCINLNSQSAASASFRYHMLGNSVGTLTLEVSTDDGLSWTGIWTRSGSQGSAWQTANVDLSTYVGGGIQLRFNGVTSSSWQGDIVIDDLRISNTPTTSVASYASDFGNIVSQEISIFPNPATGSILNVKGTVLGTQFRLVNTTGQVLIESLIENDQVDIKSLNAGVYVIQLINDEEIITKRFVKE